MLALIDSSVSGNAARLFDSPLPGGGGVYNEGTMIVTGSSISNNTAVSLDAEFGTRGGAVENHGKLTLTDSVLSDNSATAPNGSNGASGGCIANSGTLTVTNSKLSDNFASGGNVAHGGCIDNLGGPLTLAGSTLSGNYAIGSHEAFGGGINNEAGLLTITGSTLQDNYTSTALDAVGGGLTNFLGTVTMADSTVRGNWTSGQGPGWVSGGGFFNGGGTVTVTTSTFDGNSAIADTSGLMCVGAGLANILWQDASGAFPTGIVAITDSTFTGNSVQGSAFDSLGGGIANQATLALIHSTVSGNTAATGGGLWAWYSGLNPVVTIVRNTIIAQNTATDSGPDVAAWTPLQSQGDNLIGDGSGGSGYDATDLVGTSGNAIDPKLGPLQDNGGATQTMALLADSLARGHGGADTALAAAVTDTTSTTITVTQAADIAATPGVYLIQIDSEQMLVTDVDLANNTLTVERGYNGTTAAMHTSGAGVYLATDQRGVPRALPPDIGAYNVAPTTTVVVSSADPSQLNQAVIFTATVSVPAADAHPPGGTVQFQVDGANAGSPVTLAGAQASISLSSLAVGPHTITALYSGDVYSLPSSGGLTQNVDYGFGGFLSPLGQKQTFHLGQVIPIKFQLTDATGSFISSLSAITALQVQPVDASGTPLAPAFNPAPAGNTGLRFDPAANQFVFNWQTKGLTAGYYDIVLTLDDGTTHSKMIQLTNG